MFADWTQAWKESVKWKKKGNVCWLIPNKERKCNKRKNAMFAEWIQARKESVIKRKNYNVCWVNSSKERKCKMKEKKQCLMTEPKQGNNV